MAEWERSDPPVGAPAALKTLPSFGGISIDLLARCCCVIFSF
jgi:hypothetical protein